MDGQEAKDNRESWKRLIDAAHLFGTDLVTGFAGRAGVFLCARGAKKSNLR